jgi:predicted phosphohydrolase
MCVIEVKVLRSDFKALGSIRAKNYQMRMKKKSFRKWKSTVKRNTATSNAIYRQEILRLSQKNNKKQTNKLAVLFVQLRYPPTKTACSWYYILKVGYLMYTNNISIILTFHLLTIFSYRELFFSFQGWGEFFSSF